MADNQAAQSVYTQSRYGVSPETLSVISARNRIYAVPAWSNASSSSAKIQIGVVANFNPTEGRTLEPVRGIGYGDRVMELVPGMTDPMSMSVTRTAQYLSMIMQVFGYKGGVDGICRSLRHHKYPFDIRQELIIGALAKNAYGSFVESDSSGIASSSGSGASSISAAASSDGIGGPLTSAIITVYEACWMSDWSVTYASDTALVQEDCTIQCTDIVASDNTSVTDSDLELFNKAAVSKYINSGVGQ